MSTPFRTCPTFASDEHQTIDLLSPTKHDDTRLLVKRSGFVTVSLSLTFNDRYIDWARLLSGSDSRKDASKVTLVFGILKRLWRKTLAPLVMKNPLLRHVWLRLRGDVTLLDVGKIRFSIQGGRNSITNPFVFTPADFPKGIRYHILAHGSLFLQVLPFLQLAVPDSVFCGFVREDNLSIVGDDYLVVASEYWPDLMNDAQLVVPRDHLVVFIPIVGDYYGYWDVTSGVVERFSRDLTGEIRVPGRLIRHRLFNIESHGMFGNKAIVSRRSYLKYYDELVQSRSDLIHEVADRLSNQRSRDLYRFLFSADPEAMFARYWSMAFSKVQYCDYVRLRSGDTVIDGGIHLGFEIPFLMAMVGAEGRLYCIDPMGLDCLHPIVRRTAELFPSQIQDIRVALWNQEGFLNLPVGLDGQAIGKLAGHSVDGLASRSFRCRQLDDIVSEHGIERVDYVKLDLEGAEPEALEGMQKTIEKFRPSLAVSIYHEPCHMWEIPLGLMDRCIDYSFYVEHYSYQRWECILYAIPSKR